MNTSELDNEVQASYLVPGFALAAEHHRTHNRVDYVLLLLSSHSDKVL